jgi:hypothetical protein
VLVPLLDVATVPAQDPAPLLAAQDVALLVLHASIAA